MFSRFTASARRVMQRAFREAKRCQHDFVGTEHLLYALLRDADGPAYHLLRTLGAAPDLMLQKVELSLQRHDTGLAMEQFPLSPASKRVFRAALEEAERFHHQLIGPQHILLGLMRESDCEAAQILAAHRITLDALWTAVAELPADQFQESKFQGGESTRVPLGDNPSADELERWIAPAMTHESTSDGAAPALGQFQAPVSPAQAIEAQLRVTQLLLGGLIGYAFGHWLGGWMMGSIMACAGVGVASFRSTWLGIFLGACCGLFITPIFLQEMTSPMPVIMGALGAFLASFLGDGWRPASLADNEPRQEEKQPEEPNSEQRE